MTRFSSTLWYGLNSGCVYKMRCSRIWIWKNDRNTWKRFKEYDDIWGIFIESGYIVPLI